MFTILDSIREIPGVINLDEYMKNFLIKVKTFKAMQKMQMLQTMDAMDTMYTMKTRHGSRHFGY